MSFGSVSEWMLVIFAAATAYSAWQTGKTTKELNRLMGALESHSTVRLRMLAKSQNVAVVAYDPELLRYPGHIPMVGNEWHLDKIYLAIPRDFRKGHDT
jgi:hypothetical protein